jgi:hypothetical protein
VGSAVALGIHIAEMSTLQIFKSQFLNTPNGQSPATDALQARMSTLERRKTLQSRSRPFTHALNATCKKSIERMRSLLDGHRFV